jgi:hypothetical protein
MPESWLLEESAEDEELKEGEGTSRLQFWGLRMRRMAEDVAVFEKYNYSSLSTLRLFGLSSQASAIPSKFSTPVQLGPLLRTDSHLAFWCPSV